MPASVELRVPRLVRGSQPVVLLPQLALRRLDHDVQSTEITPPAAAAVPIAA
ncbi:MAG TPA: hypothetical protein VFZ65_05960 [Planctomycetota bacterium]|nr:hypothetical protein [Planctomycetota bacterium]